MLSCRQKSHFSSVEYFFWCICFLIVQVSPREKKDDLKNEVQHELKHLTTCWIEVVLAGLVIWHLMARLLISHGVSAKSL